MLVPLFGELWGAPRNGGRALTPLEFAAVPWDNCFRSILAMTYAPERSVTTLVRFPPTRLSERLPCADCVWLRRRDDVLPFVMAAHDRLGRDSPAFTVAARTDLVRLICDAMD
jgi:hypothetical protein